MVRPRIDTMLFPDGKSKALTLSYDDGVVQDRRLVALMNRHKVKGTFNIGSGILGVKDTADFGKAPVDVSKVEADEVKFLYAGHEVAGHGLYHSSLVDVGTPAAMYEIIEDKRRLEELVEGCVRGFAYPFGAYNKNAKALLRLAGYEYARVVPSTGTFELPTDFLEWKATCHHKDENLMELANSFCKDNTPFRRPQLFYLWGHSYEFDFDDTWNVIEEFLEHVSRYSDLIWFATNIEICDYINAFRALRYSADGKFIYNPSATAVWIEIHGKKYRLEGGTTTTIQ